MLIKELAFTVAPAISGAVAGGVVSYFVARAAVRREKVESLREPFRDALVNLRRDIPSAQVMNALFNEQSIVVAKAKEGAGKRRKGQIDKAWQEYEQFYSMHAKHLVVSQLAAPDPAVERPVKAALENHMHAIIRLIR